MYGDRPDGDSGSSDVVTGSDSRSNLQESALSWLTRAGGKRAATVVHVHNDYDILIDRTTKWGNPFPITAKMTRKDVINLYEEYVRKELEDPDSKLTYKELMSMKGKRLGCWCAPKPCHGDVLVDIIEERCDLEDAETNN